MIYNDFEKNKKYIWLAGDTETYTFIDGIKVTNSELIKLGKDKPSSWFREHASVQAYAWLLSDGIHFAWLESFEEYCDFCCEHKVKAVWWYNAKFDFAILDYQLLKNNWQINSGKENKDHTYSSLHSDTGQRYSLKLWLEYRGKGRTATTRHKHVHSWTNYDFCNLFGGGLKKCLEAFNVKDYDGNDIRKLEMDYQADNTLQDENAVQYMRNDVFGLFHLIRIADEFLQANFGYKIAGAKPDVMTAGGLAKRVLLENLYNTKDKRKNIKQFQRIHKIDIAIDRCIREHNLYRGGITICNEYKQGRLIEEKIYRYDVNSMYPAQMRKMPDLIGRPRSMTVDKFKQLTNKKQYCIILEIDELRGHIKKDMVGVWYDCKNKCYTEDPEINKDDKSLFIFLDEFKELQNWYSLTYHVKRVIVIKKKKIKGYEQFIDKYYKMKNDAKAEKNKVKQQFAKLILNSCYGKLSERPERIKTHRELTEQDYVHLVNDGLETDEMSIMSVIQGALVTSMARTSLLEFIRKICPNVKHDFIYCDTDSVHSLTKFDGTNDFELGAMKLEFVADAGKFLAPKTYFEYSKKDGYEFHTKGVPTKVIDAVIGKKDLQTANKIFNVGSKFIALAGFNVSGGKALIPVPKLICRKDNLIMRNDDGEYLDFDEMQQIFE